MSFPSNVDDLIAPFCVQCGATLRVDWIEAGTFTDPYTVLPGLVTCTRINDHKVPREVTSALNTWGQLKDSEREWLAGAIGLRRDHQSDYD